MLIPSSCRWLAVITITTTTTAAAAATTTMTTATALETTMTMSVAEKAQTLVQSSGSGLESSLAFFFSLSRSFSSIPLQSTSRPELSGEFICNLSCRPSVLPSVADFESTMLGWKLG